MVKLNIGCGPNIFPFTDWINYDKVAIHSNFKYYAMMAAELSRAERTNTHCNPECLKSLQIINNEERSIVNYIKNGGNILFKQHDLINGFPQHEDNSVDAIYIGQTIEHISYFFDVPKFLKECFRILKPGKVIRITTPDFDLLIQAYLNNNMNKFYNEQPEIYKNEDPGSQLAMIMYGCSSNTSSQTNYEGHMHLFNKISMKKVLINAGFKDIEFYYEPGKSKDLILANEVIDKGLSHSFIVEAIK